ncbi:hypothetical protein [Pseudobacillus wudalianchiensis]|uniref:Uncharacterized protein n=1 Tax=Pseudobacillus wudalianchiensis TaxID=1743143 RepID=A0A1B9B8Y0_9BACI|nr:hypothetical protein [Bacillus wudalianchiensis]OCA92564.1 hypothetical protein A8F95_02375 [Bacillus wudalianchiensis]
MNKRQRKKLDKKLILAIRELNNDVALSEGFPPITHERVLTVLKKVKETKGGIARTLKDYRFYIKQ